MNANADALSRNLPEVCLPIKKRKDDSPYRYPVKRSFRFDPSTEDSSCESPRKYNTRKKGKPETPGKYLERDSANVYQSTDEEIALCYNTRKNRRKQETPTRHLEQASTSVQQDIDEETPRYYNMRKRKDKRHPSDCPNKLQPVFINVQMKKHRSTIT
jgi:hypothetical protein